MQKLHFSIQINAPRQKVWETMLNDSTYREWTALFMPGSYFEGSWGKGSKIKFLGPNNGGKTEGMVSQIADNRPYNYISIKHLGIITNGVEDTESEEAKKWSNNVFENYTLKEVNGGTELSVDTDTPDDFVKDMSEAWPKALEKLKELAEQ